MKLTTNINSNFVCHCARVRHRELLEIFAESSDPSYVHFKEKYGIGDQCASCEFEVKAILDDYLATSGRAPVKAPIKKRIPMRARIRSGWHRFRVAIEKELRPRINNHNCMFFLRTECIQSSLVLSNLSRPETDLNPNGARVHFDYRIYDQEGRLIIHRRRLSLASNETLEIDCRELLVGFDGDVIGSIFVDYYDLKVTNTLRAYAVLNYFADDGSLLSRQHYHDKYFSLEAPGYVENPCVLEAGHDCYLAIVNCVERPVTGDFCLEVGGKVERVPIRLEGRQTFWKSIGETFQSSPGSSLTGGRFWIESRQYFMTYFFWFRPESRTLFGQHH